jgi:hypothetical protein
VNQSTTLSFSLFSSPRAPPRASWTASPPSRNLRKLSHASLCSAQSARAHSWLQYELALQRPQYRSLLSGAESEWHLQHIGPERSWGLLSFRGFAASRSVRSWCAESIGVRGGAVCRYFTASLTRFTRRGVAARRGGYVPSKITC